MLKDYRQNAENQWQNHLYKFSLLHDIKEETTMLTWCSSQYPSRTWLSCHL